MQNLEITSIEDAGRATAVWSSDAVEQKSRFASLAWALVPAALILVVASTLLVFLLK